MFKYVYNDLTTANGDLVDEKYGYPHLHIIHNTNVCFNINVFKICGGGGGVDPIPCVSTHRISDPRSGPAQLLPPHVKQRSHPHGVRPQIPDR